VKFAGCGRRRSEWSGLAKTICGKAHRLFTLVRSLEMKIDRDYVRETLVRLVRINSVNPTLVPGAPGEREIAEFIAASLTGLD